MCTKFRTYGFSSMIVAAGLLMAAPSFADDYTELHGDSASQAKILGVRSMADSYRQHWETTTVDGCKGVAIGNQSTSPTKAQPGRPQNTVTRPGLDGSETIVTGSITNVCNGN